MATLICHLQLLDLYIGLARVTSTQGGRKVLGLRNRHAPRMSSPAQIWLETKLDRYKFTRGSQFTSSPRLQIYFPTSDCCKRACYLSSLRVPTYSMRP